MTRTRCYVQDAFRGPLSEVPMEWWCVNWTDETQPRTERPVTLFRTGPTPASRWGFARLIRANRATFPHGPTA